jgi:hypothetical protein
MALSTNLIDHTTATVVAAGTSVAAVLAVPDNCHSILVINPTTGAGAITIYVGNGTAGGALTIANSTPIPAGGSVAFGISSQSRRPGPANFIYDAAGATVVPITYINQCEG